MDEGTRPKQAVWMRVRREICRESCVRGRPTGTENGMRMRGDDVVEAGETPVQWLDEDVK